MAKDGSDEIGALKRARDELNAYCEAVNAPIGASNTPFIEALGHYLQLKREHSDLPVWSFEPMKNWSQKDQVRLREKVSELAMQLQEMGQPSNNPFWGSRRNTFSPVEHNQATEVLNQAISMLQSISSYAGQLATHLGLGRPVTLVEVDIICRAAQRAAEAPRLQGLRLSTNDWQTRRDAIRELLEAGNLMVKTQAQHSAMLIEHPLIASSVFHYEFEFIHPFEDGNGRMGRLWQTLILSQWNPLLAHIPVETLIHEHQQEYYAAINRSSEHSDSAAFIEFMLQMILDATPRAQSEALAGAQSESILRALVPTPLSANELIAHLNLRSKTGAFKRAIKALSPT